MTTTVDLPPDADAVLAACRAATADHHVPGLITQSATDARTPHGVRIRVATAVHQALAVCHLQALGYAVASDSRPLQEEAGEALLVTGWDSAGLTTRAGFVERAVRELVHQHTRLAADALTLYRGYVEELGLTHVDALAATAEEFVVHAVDQPRRMADRAGVRAYAVAPVAREDMRLADAAAAVQLRRVAVAETAHRKLVDAYKDTVQAVVQLFCEYRDVFSHPVDRAAADAVLEASASAAACVEMARNDVDRYFA